MFEITIDNHASFREILLDPAKFFVYRDGQKIVNGALDFKQVLNIETSEGLDILLMYKMETQLKWILDEFSTASTVLLLYEEGTGRSPSDVTKMMGKEV